MAFLIEWDKPGEKLFETGVDRCVLYVLKDTISDPTDPYDIGVPWNGVTNISQSASGGEPTPLWADNSKYLNLISTEEANLSIEAYTYPDEFEACDGSREIGTAGTSGITGVSIGQQPRKQFAITYRTLLGNDQKSTDYGYKLHIVYGCYAAPSDRSYATVNDSPEAISFSWSISTTPVELSGYKPTSVLTIDSTKIAQAKLTAIENVLYGKAAAQSTDAVDPKILLPAGIVDILNHQ